MVWFRFSKGLNREPDPKNVKLHIQSGSSSHALNAILPLVVSGQPYEAHQKARTFASRYSKSGQYNTAIDVLFQSVRELLKVSQQGSRTDLTLFLLDPTAVKSPCTIPLPCTKEVRTTLQEIAMLYFAIPPPRTQPDNPLGAMISSMLGSGMPGGGAPPRRMLSPAVSGLSAPGLD
ncbi:uncharacterized protein HD556DRAFT_1504040 [Suillus plorans]|uniref:Uncharacterized protein n=1 Tax=Suillus plorans TaxID=116603 RepID=A0A9P7DCC0_9AGAM|nr:uncharacterized protein HD556DRAFT_1504040 [Suillus plorans]KAG1787102.1 hypothetical protein HD556DRAFT_1504040 [Suillus plorans]